MKNRLLSAREASLILGIEEKDIIDLAQKGIISSFKVGGEILRFRNEDILKTKKIIKKKYRFSEKRGRKTTRLREFIYFNDFYILCTLVIMVLLWIIIKDFY